MLAAVLSVAALGCGTVGAHDATSGQGYAVAIRAVRVGCPRARAAARACILGDRRGWRATRTPAGRTRLAHGRAVVRFTLVGRGGCGPR